MQNNTWHFKILDNNEKKFGVLIRQINNIIISNKKTKGTETHADFLFNYVWLGNIYAANSLDFLKNNAIKYIINVTPETINRFTFIEYATFPINDSEACYNNYISIMENAADIIDKAISEKKPILVHCKRGHHRSACIIAFYLMKYHKMTLANSIHLIKNIRPTAFRRMTCMLKTLIYYEYLSIYSDCLYIH